jgi:hypothetical protein
MDIILKILGMYGIAFSIAMFVAAIIWLLYKASTSNLLSKAAFFFKKEK